MCEELNLTAVGKIDFVKPEILLGDIALFSQVPFEHERGAWNWAHQGKF